MKQLFDYVRVIFRYDASSSKWEIFVRNVENETEAKQAFNAVLLTCKDVVVGMEHTVEPFNDTTFEVIPAVTLAGASRALTIDNSTLRSTPTSVLEKISQQAAPDIQRFIARELRRRRKEGQ